MVTGKESEGARLALRGGGGEPVDLWRTILSHGVASLPPMKVDEVARTLEVTLPVGPDRARTVVITQGRRGFAEVTMLGRTPGSRERSLVLEQMGHILRLDEDLSPFYAMAESDPHLAWSTAGAGRMIRSATVFEEVVKTICTTNCAWSATEKMVAALVSNLGIAAPTAPDSGPGGRTFPTPEAMAQVGEAFYRNVIRAGYRAKYLRDLATQVASKEIDLESLGRATADQISDEEVADALLALPGVGPYAAAHIMMMLGRYSRLILDSWTRPKYARLVRRKTAADATIERRFRRYGPYAGLAFWLFLTRDWVEDVS